MQSLQHLFCDQAPLHFDDYVERTFLYERPDLLTHSHPWIGVFHHPPGIPDWYMPTRSLEYMSTLEHWKASLDYLKMAICLSPSTERWLKDYTACPIVKLRHPTERPILTWSNRAFFESEEKLLLQVGSFLRNTIAIEQVVPRPGFRPLRLLQDLPWVANVDKKCRNHFGHRSLNGIEIEMLTRHTDAEYDNLLSRSIVFLELINASACNTIIECIARSTPIVVNRLDAAVYYLGSEYPLFYDDIGEVTSLLSDERIIGAHEYLVQLEKSWLDGDVFARQLKQACQEHVSIS